jgi:hypothetical protein
MLKHNNMGVAAQPNIETVICEWTADGFSYLIGFTGTGTYSGEFTLSVNNDPWYVYQTSPGNRTAYIADRGFKPSAGTKVRLSVKHEDVATQDFKGTILGGK